MNSATANGELIKNGEGDVNANLIVYWGLNDGGTDPASWDNNGTAGTLNAPGSFGLALTGLTQGTQYFYRTFASNGSGPDWAPTTESFHTQVPSINTISMNFVRGSDGTGLMARTDVAGVVPVANWNSATMANANAATGVPLVNDGGADSGATIDWQSGGLSWNVGTAGAGSPGDQLMMSGYLDQSNDGNGQIHRVTVNNIPYGNYDVYLYHSSAGGANRTARYQANGVDIWTRNLDPADKFDGFVESGYPTLADAAVLTNPAGNYVRWSSLSGGTLTIEAQGYNTEDGGYGDGSRRAPIQGIQIVASGPTIPFMITAIEPDMEEKRVTVTWNSEVGRRYGIFVSSAMNEEGTPGGWFELDDSTATDVVSTFIHVLPDPVPEKQFYHVRRLED